MVIRTQGLQTVVVIMVPWTCVIWPSPHSKSKAPWKSKCLELQLGGGRHVTDTQPISRHPVASTHFFIDWLTCSLGQLRKEGGGREKRLWTVGQGQRMTFLRKLCKDNLGEVILRDGNVCSREKRRNIIFKEAFSPPSLLSNSRDPSFHVTPAFTCQRVQWTQLEHCFFCE